MPEVNALGIRTYPDILRKRWEERGGITRVSEATGINYESVKADFQGRNSEAVTRLVAYMRIGGEEFVNEVLSLAGYGGAHKLDGQVTVMDANAVLASIIHEFADRIADGVYCHRDRAEMRPKFRQGHATLSALLASEHKGTSIKVME